VRITLLTPSFEDVSGIQMSVEEIQSTSYSRWLYRKELNEPQRTQNRRKGKTTVFIVFCALCGLSIAYKDEADWHCTLQWSARSPV
jgi:hypothetical protein